MHVSNRDSKKFSVKKDTIEDKWKLLPITITITINIESLEWLQYAFIQLHSISLYRFYQVLVIY